MSRAVLVALLLALPASARGQGDPAGADVAEGERLAKAGFFAASIARFKSAEARRPRAVHDCLVALSYFRLRKLGQAEMFATRCAERASTGDPTPAWLDSMRADIKAAIATADYAPVQIGVGGIGVRQVEDARVFCSAFAPDETFAPGLVQLPFGEHTIRVEAPGFQPLEHAISIGSRDMKTIVVRLVAAPPEAPTVRATPPLATVEQEAPGRGPWPYVALGVSGAALIGGVAFHLKALSTKEDAESSLARYHELASDYESQRTITYTFYTVAIVSGAIGAYLALRDPPETGGGFALGAEAAPDGALVTIGWRR